MEIPRSPPGGLSPSEAAARLAAEGPNALPDDARRGLLHTLIAVVREPMLLLLLGTGAVYLALGDPGEAATLLSFVVIVIAIGVVQERKTERAVAALKDLSSPRALVVRGGERARIAGVDVVRGDLVVLGEGDRVPADATLLEAVNLEVDESLLTGESAPVRKIAAGSTPPRPDVAPGGDDRPEVYSGTLVVRGHGIAEVHATGARTEMGKIGKALASVSAAPSALQREVGRTVRVLTFVAGGTCAALALAYGASRGDWMRGLLSGLTLAMAMLPEELPVVFAVFHALGARRMAKSNVLTRRMPAIEALGSATVLCTDKTGTLTWNRMRVARLDAGGVVHDAEREDAPLPEAVHALLEYAILASQPDPLDPMEAAFLALGKRGLAGTEHLHEWRPLREYPLSPDLLAVSHAYEPEGRRFLVAAKGAPEAIASLCHLGDEETASVRARARALAQQGMRVLGVARAAHAGDELPPGQHDFDFRFLGLVGLLDPVREQVPGAVAECLAAGVRVIMMTGDYPDTARAVGARVGLPEGALVTGPELAAMSDAELAERVERATIFARVVPEQKLRLVRALTAKGEVVAMTGDGVNDAPALKAAAIGIAMGGRGTDVAREAAALVLTDDDFTSIVAAVAHGRRIFDNLRKAMAYVLAVHVPVAGLSLLPVLVGGPMVLHPVHVAFLELVIDPACSIAFEMEPAEPGIMRRPPRAKDARLFDRRLLALSILQGASVLAASLGVFVLAGGATDEARARALSFVCLMAGNVALILVNRSWTTSLAASLREKNAGAAIVTFGAGLVLAAVLLAPPLRSLFAFGVVGAGEAGAAALAGALAPAWFELVKLWRRRRVSPAA